MNKFNLFDILGAIITNSSPLLECVKGKLHRHNRIVYVIPVIYKAGNVYVCDLYAVVCVKLRKDFIAM